MIPSQYPPYSPDNSGFEEYDELPDPAIEGWLNFLPETNCSEEGGDVVLVSPPFHCLNFYPGNICQYGLRTWECRQTYDTDYPIEYPPVRWCNLRKSVSFGVLPGVPWYYAKGGCSNPLLWGFVEPPDLPPPPEHETERGISFALPPVPASLNPFFCPGSGCEESNGTLGSVFPTITFSHRIDYRITCHLFVYPVILRDGGISPLVNLLLVGKLLFGDDSD